MANRVQFQAQKETSTFFHRRGVSVDVCVAIGRTTDDRDTRVHLDNAYFSCAALSKHHAILWLDDQHNEEYYLQDLHSRGGTFVNGVRIGNGPGQRSEPYRVYSRDIVQFGVETVNNETGVTCRPIVAELKLFNRHGQLYSRIEMYRQADDDDEVIDRTAPPFGHGPPTPFIYDNEIDDEVPVPGVNDAAETPILRLDSEVQVDILRRLSFADLLNCKLVCKSWHKVIKANLCDAQWIVLRVRRDYRETFQPVNALRLLQAMDDDLRSVFKLDVRDLRALVPSSHSYNPSLCGKMLIANESRAYLGAISHLQLSDCEFCDAEYFMTFIGKLHSVVSIGLDNCSIIASRYDSSKEINRKNHIDVCADDSLRDCFKSLRFLAISSDKIKYFLTQLRFFAQVVNLELLEQVELNIKFNGVSQESHAALCDTLDAYRNVTLTIGSSRTMIFGRVVAGRRDVSKIDIAHVLTLKHLTLDGLHVIVNNVSHGRLLDGLRHRAPTLKSLSIVIETDDNQPPPPQRSQWLAHFVSLFPSFVELTWFAFVVEGGGEDRVAERIRIASQAQTHMRQLRVLGVNSIPARDGHKDSNNSEIRDTNNNNNNVIVRPNADAAQRFRALKLRDASSLDGNGMIGGVAVLIHMKQLTVLSLESVAAIDNRLLQLLCGQLINLRCFELVDCCNVSDIGLTGRPDISVAGAGLANLARLETLRLANLRGGVTDATIACVKHARLKALHLEKLPGVTNAALANLLLTNPHLARLTLYDLSTNESGLVAMFTQPSHLLPLVVLKYRALADDKTISARFASVVEARCPHLRRLEYCNKFLSDKPNWLVFSSPDPEPKRDNIVIKFYYQ